jgi:hypothetical protein
MARQLIRHNTYIDAATPEEVADIVRLHSYDREGAGIRRIRATAAITLDASGNGQDEVYPCPLGWQFELRRVFINISTAADPSTGNVALTAAGKFIQYLRSGTVLAYGQPSYGSAVQVPGMETWGEEQGPYFRNGEVFEVLAKGLTASAQLIVYAQGLCYKYQKEES